MMVSITSTGSALTEAILEHMDERKFHPKKKSPKKMREYCVWNDGSYHLYYYKLSYLHKFSIL